MFSTIAIPVDKESIGDTSVFEYKIDNPVEKTIDLEYERLCRGGI